MFEVDILDRLSLRLQQRINEAEVQVLAWLKFVLRAAEHQHSCVLRHSISPPILQSVCK